MSATAAAIRSSKLLACPVVLRRAPMSVPVRVLGAPAARAAVAVRAEATAEGVGKAKGKKRPASGITKPKPISLELREFVGGAAELPRTEAIKLVWAHIKGNNLQDAIGGGDGICGGHCMICGTGGVITMLVVSNSRVAGIEEKN